MAGVRSVLETNILGAVSRIEQCRNGWRPYWYGYLSDVRKEDVDWGEFLAHREWRPFNPDQYTGWYGYRDFSDGPVAGFGSHFIDLVHYFTGAQFPLSSVCQGGTFTWDDEHRFTCPDQVQATWTYPEGFMVSYTTNFGNGGGNMFRIFGQNGMLDLGNWEKPILTAEGAAPERRCVAEPRVVEHIDRPDHMLDWLQCVRSRQSPHAPIEAGYQHAVAVLMAMNAYDTGHRMVYDAEHRTIRKG
jgi:predicted dehydrogenase